VHCYIVAQLFEHIEIDNLSIACTILFQASYSSDMFSLKLQLNNSTIKQLYITQSIINFTHSQFKTKRSSSSSSYFMALDPLIGFDTAKRSDVDSNFLNIIK
jgi:hypothetical protein